MDELEIEVLDQFATAALIGLVGPYNERTCDDVAEECYAYAVAMLEERARHITKS